MALRGTSVRLDDETLERIGRIAEAMDRPRAWLMSEAIRQYVAREEWAAYEIEKAVDAADQGKLVEHSEVKAKWETKRGTQLD